MPHDFKTNKRYHMRIYGNFFLSFYCDDVFFKNGIVNVLDEISQENKAREGGRVKYINNEHFDFFWIDVLVFSSHFVYKAIPKRNFVFDQESSFVIVFCSESMMRIIKGITGYETSLFISLRTGVMEVKKIFQSIFWGGKEDGLCNATKVHLGCLTHKEKVLSSLLKKGMSQMEISLITSTPIKSVSSKLRSAMSKYYVDNLLEYRLKLIIIDEISPRNLSDNDII